MRGEAWAVFLLIGFTQQIVVWRGDDMYTPTVGEATDARHLKHFACLVEWKQVSSVRRGAHPGRPPGCDSNRFGFNEKR